MSLERSQILAGRKPSPGLVAPPGPELVSPLRIAKRERTPIRIGRRDD